VYNLSYLSYSFEIGYLPEGLFVEDYDACESSATYCGDARLLREIHGRYDDTGEAWTSKEVIFPSLRTLFLGKMNELVPFPARESHDSKYLVMTPLIGKYLKNPAGYGTYWLVDTETGSMKKIESATLELGPDSAKGGGSPAMYSSDNLFAAYVRSNSNQYNELVVLDFLNDRSKIIAKAGKGERFFVGTDEKFQNIFRVTSSTVTFPVYGSSDATSNAREFKEVRNVEFSF
jgi:hypothetical protein